MKHACITNANIYVVGAMVLLHLQDKTFSVACLILAGVWLAFGIWVGWKESQL